MDNSWTIEAIKEKIIALGMDTIIKYSACNGGWMFYGYHNLKNNEQVPVTIQYIVENNIAAYSIG